MHPADWEALAALAKTEPLAAYLTRLVSKELEGNREYRAMLCTDPDCTAKTPEDKVSATRAFRRFTRHRIVSLGAELAWNAGDEPRSGYGFEAVGGIDSSDQLYELKRRAELKDRFTVPSLLIVYPFALCKAGWFTDSFAFGFGPTLFRGSDSEFLEFSPAHSHVFQCTYQAQRPRLWLGPVYWAVE